MSETKGNNSIQASSLDSLLKWFGDDPVFLMKTFEKEEYAREAQRGKFYANSIDWFRNNGGLGQKDTRESAVPNWYYFKSKDNEKPQSKDIDTVFSTKEVEKQDHSIKQISLICFFAVYLKDCIVTKLNDGPDIISVDTKTYFKDFGAHVCIYEFEDIKKAIQEINVTYPKIHYGQVNYSNVFSGENENGSLEIDEVLFKELEHRFDHPYYYKSKEFEYQKEWRIICPYTFKNENERYIEMEIYGSRGSFPEKYISEINHTSSMHFGSIVSCLVPNYISPFKK